MRRFAWLPLFFSIQGCSGFFYFPSRGLHGWPEQPFEELEFRAGDGVRLHGLYFPAQGESRGTVVQFHGNAGNVTSHYESLVWLTERGYAFFTFDYRGYGASERVRPSQRGVELDALAAMEVAEDLPRARPGQDLVYFGQSLGGAVLLHAYATRPNRARVRALVIEGSFHSYQEVASSVLYRHWLLFPFTGFAYALVSDEYAPAATIARISPTPLLIVHGTADRVVPPAFGQAIYDLAREPRELWLVRGTDHLRTWRSETARDLLVAKLDELGAP
jgi:fermentation-respiration switch protein FrsA (DUF1100 family)